MEDLRTGFISELCSTLPDLRERLPPRNLRRPSSYSIARSQISVAQKKIVPLSAMDPQGNDQVGFELAFYALQPSIKAIAPWRIPECYETFKRRDDLLDYAAEMHGQWMRIRPTAPTSRHS